MCCFFSLFFLEELEQNLKTSTLSYGSKIHLKTDSNASFRILKEVLTIVTCPFSRSWCLLMGGMLRKGRDWTMLCVPRPWVSWSCTVWFICPWQQNSLVKEALGLGPGRRGPGNVRPPGSFLLEIVRCISCFPKCFCTWQKNNWRRPDHILNFNSTYISSF